MTTEIINQGKGLYEYEYQITGKIHFIRDIEHAKQIVASGVMNRDWVRHHRVVFDRRYRRMDDIRIILKKTGELVYPKEQRD